MRPNISCSEDSGMGIRTTLRLINHTANIFGVPFAFESSHGSESPPHSSTLQT